MNPVYEQDGHGIARDGRCFSPPIPTGATVSWKVMEKPVYVPDQKRPATHVLAIWDRFEEMDTEACGFRQTPRGRCVAYYADAAAIEDLIESAVPAPAWIDAEMPLEVALADCLASIWDQAHFGGHPGGGHTRGEALRCLKAAVWVHRMLTDGWPILELVIPAGASVESLPAERIRAETHRLMGVIRSELVRQFESRWWEERLRKSA